MGLLCGYIGCPDVESTIDPTQTYMPPSTEREKRTSFWNKRMERWKSPAFLKRKLNNYNSLKAIQNIKKRHRIWTHNWDRVKRQVPKLREHN